MERSRMITGINIEASHIFTCARERTLKVPCISLHINIVKADSYVLNFRRISFHKKSLSICIILFRYLTVNLI